MKSCGRLLTLLCLSPTLVIGALMLTACHMGSAPVSERSSSTRSTDAASLVADEFEASVTESVAAKNVVDEIRGRVLAPAPRIGQQFPPVEEPPRAVLPTGLVVRLDRDGAWLKPHLPESAVRGVIHRGIVMLPTTALGPFRLTDATSGLQLDITPIGIYESSAELAAGHIVYRNAYGQGAHVVHGITATGTEDYIAIDAPLAVSELRYEVTLGEIVAGLRLVSNTLEFLDGTGTPRLRVAPPYVVDGNGVRHDAMLTVEGCAVDLDARAPWNRIVTPPGANRCEVKVTWGDIPYPIVVDPQWQTTTNMLIPRAYHTATLLDTGSVLVVGGYALGPGSTALNSCEFYDPTSDTWAAAAPLATARAEHTATPISSGVLVAGGATETAEYYEPASGWIAAGTLSYGIRSQHTATKLISGRVLIVGGVSQSVQVDTCELYDPTLNQWSVAPSVFMDTGHTATLMNDGRVMIVGTDDNNHTAKAKMFSEESGWTDVAAPSEDRVEHAASMLMDGNVLVAAGQWESYTAEVYSPATNQWQSTPNLSAGRRLPSVSALWNGCIAVVGGIRNPVAKGDVDLFDQKSYSWTTVDSLLTPRFAHTATVLPDNRLLIVGGSSWGFPESLGGEILTLDANGDPCTSNCECSSGICADGVCCESACDGPCETCGEGGACVPETSGSDPDDDCADEGQISCGQNGACDGNGACALYPTETDCGEAACTEATLITAQCNGGGQCVSSSLNCAPYLCDDGACKTSCASIADCASPNDCDFDGQCVPPLSNQAANESGGCGCRFPGAVTRDASSWMVLVTSSALARLLRRRGRRTGASANSGA